MSQAEIEAAFAAQNAPAAFVESAPPVTEDNRASDWDGTVEPEPAAAFATETEPVAEPEPVVASRPAAATGFDVTADTVLAATASGHADAAAAATPVEGVEFDDPAVEAGGDSASHTSIAGLFALYGKYVALFVGAGLISGSVVHFPLAPVRYIAIGAVGALVFAIASVVSELGDRDPLRLLRVATSSLALALGIGMISGSIQHFLDIPDRAALLIPVGVVLSLAAFGIRHGLRLKRTDMALIVPWLIIAVFALGFGLGKLADVVKAGGGGTRHGHENGAVAGHGGGPAGEHGVGKDAAGDGHGAGGGGTHDSSADEMAAKDDAHADKDAHAKGDDAKAAGAHGSEDSHAAEDAHVAGDEHTEDEHAADSGHAEDPAGGHAEDAGDRKASGDKDAAADAAEESHGERLRFVP